VRYLSSKRTVDDRALNKDVVERLRREIACSSPVVSVLELGAGIGTMAARLVDWGVVRRGSYTMLEMDGALVGEAHRWLDQWAGCRGFGVESGAESLRIAGGDAHEPVDLRIQFVQAEASEYLGRASEPPGFDVLVANAFLDLVDVPALLPRLFARAARRALFWFSVNFDGDTIFEPAHEHDAALLDVYHRTMDERRRDGWPAGDSRAGRHLFSQLSALGAEVLCAGASDWVVHPSGGRYEGDEAYFLHHIVHTIDEALRVRPEIDQPALAAWIATRHDEITRDTLVYIAHQLDFVGRTRG
jgi:hypothetical protein